MIDTTKLSRALRVGGAGIRAESGEGSGVNLFLPDGTCPWRVPLKEVEECRPSWVRLLGSIGMYQTWLQRAKCEHEFSSPYAGCEPLCKLCGAPFVEVMNGHYTLLPEPADVCIVPGCRKVSLCPGHTLCLDCDEKWSNAPFVKPIDNNHWTYDDDRRAWAAKQSKGGDATSAPRSRETLPTGASTAGPGDEPGSVTTFAELEAHCKAFEKDPMLPWKGVNVSVGRARFSDAYEVRLFDTLSSDPDRLHCSVIDVALPIGKHDLTGLIFKEMQSLVGSRGDEPGSFNPSDLTGLSVVTCAECKAPFDPRNSWDARVCAYCYKRVNSVEQAREDLDRPLPERIELARQELGYDDGFGVYSLPGEGK